MRRERKMEREKSRVAERKCVCASQLVRLSKQRTPAPFGKLEAKVGTSAKATQLYGVGPACPVPQVAGSGFDSHALEPVAFTQSSLLRKQ